MRKFSLIGIAMLIVSIPTFAGGILTNTNQHVSFLRMLARGASIDIDGVYSNPAGLAFLPEDGLYLSLNGQSAYQTRNIKATFPLFIEDGNTRYYKGKGAFADDPLTTINNLSDFVFSAIKAIGAILLGFGIVQIGLALKGHDASQRAQGFMTFFGGVVIYFAKDILDMIL